jgi:hypothetical protein
MVEKKGLKSTLTIQADNDTGNATADLCGPLSITAHIDSLEGLREVIEALREFGNSMIDAAKQATRPGADA